MSEDIVGPSVEVKPPKEQVEKVQLRVQKARRPLQLEQT